MAEVRVRCFRNMFTPKGWFWYTISDPVHEQDLPCPATKTLHSPDETLQCRDDLGHSGYHWSYGYHDAFYPWEDA